MKQHLNITLITASFHRDSLIKTFLLLCLRLLFSHMVIILNVSLESLAERSAQTMKIYWICFESLLEHYNNHILGEGDIPCYVETYTFLICLFLTNLIFDSPWWWLSLRRPLADTENWESKHSHLKITYHSGNKHIANGMQLGISLHFILSGMMPYCHDALSR